MSEVVCLDSRLTREELKIIGNIDDSRDQYGKKYQFISRTSIPLGLLFHDEIALKLYHMVRKTEPLPVNLAVGFENFLISEIDKKSVERRQGIGFSILSQGFVSVNIWGRGNVLFSQTYTIESNPPNLSREPLEKTGVACTWESRIMDHEYKKWQEYLTSQMGETDKLDYLRTFISGDL